MERSEFIERVRLEAGLPPAFLSADGSGVDQSARLDRLIVELGERYAAEELMAARQGPGTGLRLLRPSFEWNCDEGGEYVGRAPLPEGFLRLVQLRMDSWVYGVSSAIEPGSPEYELRCCGVPALAGNRLRPKVYLLPGKGGWEIEVRSCATSGEQAAEGLYVEIPSFAGPRLPPLERRVMERVVSRVAERLRELV